MTHDWSGLYPSLVTPFDGDGELDVAALGRVARFVVDAGADGILANALAGEVGELTPAERRTALAAIVDAVDRAVPVLAGADAPTVDEACDLAREAVRGGADGVVVPVRAPAGQSPDALVDRLVAVAAAVDVPVVIQDAPAYVGGALGLDVIERAVERADTIRHLKIEGGSSAVEQATARLGSAIGIWGGDGGRQLLDCLRLGAVGMMPGAEVIDGLARIVAAEREGDPDRADELMRRALPLLVFQMQSLEQYVACAKAILCARGVMCHEGARAGAALTPAARRLLAAHLAAVELPAIDGDVLARLQG